MVCGRQDSRSVERIKRHSFTAFENFKEKVSTSTIGKELLDKITFMPDTGKAEFTITSFFCSSFGVLGVLYVVLVLGIFFIASPSIYINGLLLKLVPTRARSEAENILKEIGHTLTKWLKGKIFSMFVVFVLTAIGLLILGVPLWSVLSLVAGLLSFVPNFGPIIALVPAVLFGSIESSITALLILVLYTLVQVLESILITPKIQRQLINIPPALMLQLFYRSINRRLGFGRHSVGRHHNCSIEQSLYRKTRTIREHEYQL
jgi:predicted PurR-regulated permease PerM